MYSVFSPRTQYALRVAAWVVPGAAGLGREVRVHRERAHVRIMDHHTVPCVKRRGRRLHLYRCSVVGADFTMHGMAEVQDAKQQQQRRQVVRAGRACGGRHDATSRRWRLGRCEREPKTARERFSISYHA